MRVLCVWTEDTSGSYSEPPKPSRGYHVDARLQVLDGERFGDDALVAWAILAFGCWVAVYNVASVAVARLHLRDEGVESAGVLVGDAQLRVRLGADERAAMRERDAVEEDVGDQDERWMKSLREEIMGASVELKGRLCKKKMRLTELAGLRKGDIIPIDMPDSVLMLANGIPAFRGKLGEANGNLALQVIGKVERPEADSGKQARLEMMREQILEEETKTKAKA